MTMPEKLGPGKWKRKSNVHYCAADFWRHNDSDGSDIEAEAWDTMCIRKIWKKLKQA